MAVTEEPAADGASGPSASAILQAIDVGVLVVDPAGRASYANPAWTRLADHDGPAGSGSGWQADLGLGPTEVRRLLDAGPGAAIDVHVGNEEGRVLHLDVAADLADMAPSAEGTGGDLVLTLHDVSVQRAEQRALSLAAQRDALTGLWNRSRFNDFVAQALTGEERDEALHCAVLFVDVDQFKSVNDRGGHAAGDRLLRALAGCLTAAVRPGDVVARYGGDEFTILCEQLDEIEAAVIARRVFDAVARAPEFRETGCSVSVGRAVSTGPSDDAEALISRADLDMYQAKRRRDRPAAPVPGRPPVPTGGPPAIVPDDLAVLHVVAGQAQFLRQRWDDLGPEHRNAALDAIVRLAASGTLGR